MSKVRGKVLLAKYQKRQKNIKLAKESLIKRNSTTHQYHCVPDIENSQKLKSVWANCVNLKEKTLIVSTDTFELLRNHKLAEEIY